MDLRESLATKAKTGIWGMDNILPGGFSRGHVFPVEGAPGAHESAIREHLIDGRGLTIGEPLDRFQGVLGGVPIYFGETQPLLQESPA
jgi:hypothetical protein